MPCVRIVVLILLMLSSVSCSLGEKTPSIIVIAVDSLPYNSILCADNELNKGFSVVCDQMARFTHAFTPSILAQPAIASILTALYPIDHGVHHNGDDILSAKYSTIAEAAIRKGYRTSFFSGGAPIFRRSGLQQGFEVFDDTLALDINRFYRPVLETFKAFLSWQKSEASSGSYLSFIYIPDLQFPETATVDNKGVAREQSYSGQLMELDESMEYLIKELKKRGEWNKNWIFFMGLNGHTPQERLNEAPGLNLFHENTRATLFVKKPEKEKDRINPWVVDMQVSLVDVGRTLFDIVGEDPISATANHFSSLTLKNKLLNYERNNVKDRMLILESAWGYWKDIGPIRYAFQLENYLLIHDKTLKVYNTAVDRNQIYPLDYRTALQTESIVRALEIIDTLQLPPWEIYDIEGYKSYLLRGPTTYQSIEPSEKYIEAWGKTEKRESAEGPKAFEAVEKERALKAQKYLKIDLDIQRLNFIKGSLWDTRRDYLKIDSH